MYFSQLMKDTWEYLGNLVEPVTGLPYDSTARQPVTSEGNVGLYLASVSIAAKTGLISQEEGFQRAQAAFQSLDRVEKWRGFPRPWFRVKELEPAFGNEFSYGGHLAHLVGGLILAKRVFPEMAGSVEAMLAGMAFKDLYDARTGWLKGGYNTHLKTFAVFQPWGRWYYKFFASETRLLSFYAIARGAIPLEHWNALLRTTWQKGPYTILSSGYEEGGLFTHYAAGLFLDERRTTMGEHQQRYALAQMKYAEKIGAPVWGWSSCETPGGTYLGYGELRDDIVTPHASILAAIYFPKRVYRNLRELDKRGVRKPFMWQGQKSSWGFRDSVNWRTGKVAKNTLTMNQAMIFLSLANRTRNGVVWKTFRKDPHVRKGLRNIALLEE